MWAPGAAAAAARIGVCMVASAVVGGVVVSGSAGTPTRLLPRDGSTATAFTWLLPRVRWPGTSTEGGGDHAPKARKQMRSHRGAAGQGVASSRRLCVLAASPAPSQANVPDTAPASPAATNTSRVSGAQKRVLLIIGGITASFAVIAAPFLIVPWLPKRVFGALPYLPTSKRRVKVMFNRLPQNIQGRRFVDLGSGDGVLVHAAAKRGMLAHGVELNPWLVVLSRITAWRAGVAKSATFTLVKKLESEAKPGCFVVSHKFALPGWQVLWEEDSMLFYHFPSPQHGWQRSVAEVLEDVGTADEQQQAPANRGTPAADAPALSLHDLVETSPTGRESVDLDDGAAVGAEQQWRFRFAEQ